MSHACVPRHAKYLNGGKKKRSEPSELGTGFERELRKGLAVGLIIQVGVAEEA